MARIIVADDEPHILRVMSMWISRHGYEVAEASNGQLALDEVRRGNIDLIISDMNMPVMDGLALAHAVRMDECLDIPFLLLTARCDQAALHDKLAPYNVRLYPKPFVPSRLVAEIDELLAGNSAMAK